MYELKEYDKDIEYRVWVGEIMPQEQPSYSRGVSLIVTPSNLNMLINRVQEVHSSIEFTSLIIKCPANLQFDGEQSFEAFAPYAKLLIVDDSCKRVDFTIFEPLVLLEDFSTLIPKPKKLRLSAYPQLRSAVLGQVVKAETLENVKHLKSLRLFRKLHIAKTGWDWLKTLPNLEEFWLVQTELQDLQGIPEVESLLDFSLAYPRNLTSINGIDSFKNLKKLEIEGAKQLHDFGPIASLHKLEYLTVIGNSGKPDSTDFLNSLPLLKGAVIGNYDYTKVDGEFVMERY